MQAEPLIDVLKRIDPKRTVEIDALAARIVEESRRKAREAVAVWRGSDPALSERAEKLLAELDELALAPLLESAGTNSAAQDAWLLRYVALLEKEMRRKVAARVNKLMADKRPVPPPPGLRDEIKPPPRRVCDEAFLLARRFINPSESQSQYHSAANQFLNLPEKERDAQIQKAQQARLWRQWLEDAEE